MKKVLLLLTLLCLTVTTNAGEFTKVGCMSCGCGQYVQRVIVAYDNCRRPIYHTRYVPVRHTCRSTYHAPVRRCNTRYEKPRYSTYNTYRVYNRYNNNYRHHHSGISIGYRSKHWNVNYHAH